MTAGLRALHVSDFAAPYPGAFIRQLRMLDDELRGRGGARLTLAFPVRACGRPWVQTLLEQGCDVRFVPDATSRAQRRVSNTAALLLDELRPHVVHTHFGTYDLSVTRAVAQWRASGVGDPALLWHYRTALEEPVAERSVLRRTKDWLKYERAGRHVDACIGVTNALAREVAERGMGDRARGVVAGCDTETFRPDDAVRARVRAELGVRDDQVLVLHMGWHWHRKGGDLLAEAARRLAADPALADALVFASIGAPADEVEAPVRSLPPTDTVSDLHQASDIFVSASRSEGFGNGLVEALACERMAVAAFVEGQREIFSGLEEGCVPVAPEDAGALAAAIRHLVDTRDTWPELGRRNRQHVVKNNSMRRWARELADVYAELRPGRLPGAGAGDIAGRLSA